jgi:hypothetical protein
MMGAGLTTSMMNGTTWQITQNGSDDARGLDDESFVQRRRHPVRST